MSRQLKLNTNDLRDGSLRGEVAKEEAEAWGRG